MSTGEHLSCDVCRMRSEGAFSSLDKALLGELDREKTTHLFRPGQTIFQEGAPPLAVYCIHTGLVKLYKMGEAGEPFVIRLLRPGEIAGYRPLLANEPYAATAEAVESSLVCVIPRETLRRLLDRSKTLGYELMARLARELRVSEDQALSLAQSPARQRAAQLLIFLHESSHRSKRTGDAPIVALQRKEMAQMIGVTPETFSRILHSFFQHGLVQLTREGIVLKDLARLQTIAFPVGRPA